MHIKQAYMPHLIIICELSFAHIHKKKKWIHVYASWNESKRIYSYKLAKKENFRESSRYFYYSDTKIDEQHIRKERTCVCVDTVSARDLTYLKSSQSQSIARWQQQVFVAFFDTNAKYYVGLYILIIQFVVVVFASLQFFSLAHYVMCLAHVRVCVCVCSSNRRASMIIQRRRFSYDRNFNLKQLHIHIHIYRVIIIRIMIIIKCSFCKFYFYFVETSQDRDIHLTVKIHKETEKHM